MSYFLKGENIVLGYQPQGQIQNSGFSFEFPAGKLIALIGPNGAGKSTFFRALLNTEGRISGQFFVKDQTRPVHELKASELSKHIAYLAQEHQYPRDVWVVDFLRYAFLNEAGLFGTLPTRNDPQILGPVETFHLGTLLFRTLGELSTGERQRVFLLRALLQGAKILLLDEPTNHLDPGARRVFWETLVEMHALGKFEIVIGTHDLDFVKSHARWVCAFKKNIPVYNGEREDFFGSNTEQTLYNS